MNKFILNPDKNYVFIMGAGASKDDNLPIQDEILTNILKGQEPCRSTSFCNFHFMVVMS